MRSRKKQAWRATSFDREALSYFRTTSREGFSWFLLVLPSALTMPLLYSHELCISKYHQVLALDAGDLVTNPNSAIKLTGWNWKSHFLSASPTP